MDVPHSTAPLLFMQNGRNSSRRLTSSAKRSLPFRRNTFHPQDSLLPKDKILAPNDPNAPNVPNDPNAPNALGMGVPQGLLVDLYFCLRAETH